MSNGIYGKYVITEPKFVTEMAFHDFTKVSGFTFPDEVYLDKDILKEANHWLDIIWVWERPNPPDLPGAHSHPFDEIVLLIGSNPKNLRDLGGEVEWYMGEGEQREKFILTSTTMIFVPRGVVHAPLRYNRVDRPICNVAIGLNTGDYA
jgi:hypothetical protein